MLYPLAGILFSLSSTWTSDFRASRTPHGWLEYWTRWPAYQALAKKVGWPPPSPGPNWLSCLILMLCSVPQLSTLLLLPLICVHSLRRLRECLCVSVFSDTGAVHLVQYMFGLGYYVLLGLTALCSDRQGQGSTGVVCHSLHCGLLDSVLLF